MLFSEKIHENEALPIKKKKKKAAHTVAFAEFSPDVKAIFPNLC